MRIHFIHPRRMRQERSMNALACSAGFRSARVRPELKHENSIRLPEGACLVSGSGCFSKPTQSLEGAVTKREEAFPALCGFAHKV